MDWMHILVIAMRVVMVVLLVGLVIFVHELGHFLAARRLGLVVDVFSLGFGPALWKRKIGSVEYKICAIPLGGYVAIPQLDPDGMEAVQGENAPAGKEGAPPLPRHLPPVAPWKRVVVAVAGPLGNVLLAVVLAWGIYLTPHAVTGGASTLIGTVEEDSPAWTAGLRSGQVIERVNGARVATWYDFMIECHLAGDPSRGVTLVVQESNAVRQVQVPLMTLTNAGIHLNTVAGLAPKSFCIIGDVVSNSVAEAGGLRAHDAIRKVNALPIVGALQFVNLLAVNGTNEVVLEVLRQRETLTVRLLPRMDVALGKAVIGVRPMDEFSDVPAWMQYSNPWRQIKSDGLAVFRLLQALFFPQHKGESQRAAKSVGGMPTIVVVLWGAIQSGLLNCLGLLRMISINLAIINLLPIPVLDGGHVMFALLEMITRRKLPPKVMAVIVNFFAVLLIGLMLLLIVCDPVMRRFAPKQWPWQRTAVSAAVSPTNAPSATPAAAVGVGEGVAP
jgi:regulator of sigma E protease